MASQNMLRYINILFQNLSLPRYIVKYDGTTRHFRKGTHKEWTNLILYIVFAFSHDLLLIYFHIKTASSTAVELSDTTRSLLVMFAMLFVSIGALSAVFIYTICQSNFPENTNAVC